MEAANALAPAPKRSASRRLADLFHGRAGVQAGGPLAFPAVVAGSIFTFSLTLGDYITPSLVSNNQFIGNVVFANITNNLPLASAFATVPVVIMIIYLVIA